MLPLVSVIVPCYNHEEFVQECIQSIIDQDYQNIELIIIDDGSKDQSVQKIEEMRLTCEKRFVRFEFRHRPNKGLCATLNEALEWCQGEYISSLASDDVWLNHKTQVQVNYLNDNQNSIGVFGGIILINNMGEVIRSIIKKTKRYTFNDIFLHEHILPAPTNMCRTSELKKYTYDVSIKIEDWYMWLKLTEHGGTLDYISQGLALYRRHENNLSSQLLLMNGERMRIIRQFDRVNANQAISHAFLCSAMEDKNLFWKYIYQSYSQYNAIVFSKKFWKCVIKRCIR